MREKILKCCICFSQMDVYAFDRSNLCPHPELGTQASCYLKEFCMTQFLTVSLDSLKPSSEPEENATQLF